MRITASLTAFVLIFILSAASIAAQDAGAADAAVAAAASTDTATPMASTGDALTGWTLWVRDSAIGKLIAAALVSVITLGINQARGKVKDRAGTIQVLTLALIGGVMSSIFAGAPLDPKLVESIVSVALLAIGGYTGVKKLAAPSDAVASATDTAPPEPPAGTP